MMRHLQNDMRFLGLKLAIVACFAACMCSDSHRSFSLSPYYSIFIVELNRLEHLQARQTVSHGSVRHTIGRALKSPRGARKENRRSYNECLAQSRFCHESPFGDQEYFRRALAKQTYRLRQCLFTRLRFGLAFETGSSASCA